MAEHRLHRLSVLLFLLITALAAASTIVLYRSEVSWESWVLVLLWATVIGGFHAISVPTPSGKRIYLAIGPAVAALVLLPDLLAVMTAITIGLVIGWIVLRWRSKTDRDADSDYVAEAPIVGDFSSSIRSPVLVARERSCEKCACPPPVSRSCFAHPGLGSDFRRRATWFA